MKIAWYCRNCPFQSRDAVQAFLHRSGGHNVRPLTDDEAREQGLTPENAIKRHFAETIHLVREP